MPAETIRKNKERWRKRRKLARLLSWSFAHRCGSKLDSIVDVERYASGILVTRYDKMMRVTTFELSDSMPRFSFT